EPRRCRSFAAKLIVEPPESRCEVRAQLQDFSQRIATSGLESSRYGRDRERTRLQARADFSPIERRRNGSSGERTSAERSGDRLDLAVLQEVEVDAPASVAHPSGHTRD